MTPSFDEVATERVDEDTALQTLSAIIDGASSQHSDTNRNREHPTRSRVLGEDRRERLRQFENVEDWVTDFLVEPVAVTV